MTKLQNAHDVNAELLEACRALLNWGRDHTSPVHEPELYPLLVNAHNAIVKAERIAD